MNRHEYIDLANALKLARAQGPPPDTPLGAAYLEAMNNATHAIARALAHAPKFDSFRFCRNAGAPVLLQKRQV